MKLKDTFPTFPLPASEGIPPIPDTWQNPLPKHPHLPIYPPPQNLIESLPKLPPRKTPNPESSFVDLTTRSGLKYSRHFFPACFLRATKPSPFPPPPSPDLPKKERDEGYKRTLDVILKLREEHTRDLHKGHSYPQILWIFVSRFVNPRRCSGGTSTGTGLTLFLHSATGFPKEVWEPFIKYLFIHNPEAGKLIDEIWCYDPVQHGDSAIVNAEALKNSVITDWMDNARDVLNFLLHYLPTQSGEELPTSLKKESDDEVGRRTSEGYRGHRTIVGIGSSWGGCTLTLGAARYPALFSSLILIDPMIIQAVASDEPVISSWVPAAIRRRDTWPNSAEASFTMNQAFLGKWEKEVLEAYVEHGLYTPTGNKAVVLKLPKAHEVAMYTESSAPIAAWHQLPSIDERIELFWIMPGLGMPLKNGLLETIWRVWLRPKNSSNVRVDGAEHLIAMEKPKETANFVGNFLVRKYGARYMASKL